MLHLNFTWKKCFLSSSVEYFSKCIVCVCKYLSRRQSFMVNSFIVVKWSFKYNGSNKSTTETGDLIDNGQFEF